jgi:epoxyqueuosine reductase
MVTDVDFNPKIAIIILIIFKMETKQIKEFIKSVVPDMDHDFVVGFAYIGGLLNGELTEYNYCIVIGKKLDDKILDSIKDAPTHEYLGLYDSTNKDLHELSLKLSGFLGSKKIPHLVIKPTGISQDTKNYDPDTLTYYFSHKMAATRAGLGWIGKTALMVTEKFGPRVRFVSLLLKEPLEKNGIPIEKSVVPVEKSLCGNCKICVEECPAGAGSGMQWDIHIGRDSFFDAYACKNKCRELSLKKLGRNITICGICVKVCPIGRQM